MADGVMSDEIKQDALDNLVATNPWARLKMGLFEGGPTIDHATEFGDLTQVSGTGYGLQDVTGFTASVLTAAFKARTFADMVTFENTGGSPWTQATGWFFVEDVTDKLVFAQYFLAGFYLPAGETFDTIPVLTFGD